MKLCRDYRPALRDAVILQVVVVLLASMVLDGGQCLGYALVALLPYWAGALAIMLRRSATPTRLDLAAIRFGYLAVLAATPLVTAVVWSLPAML
jgi:hypothetical protein